ncbi:uncharacterized protein LOC128230101 isoform X2 [Mya arenaria]|nr:uncharacterized protein LOC128230101 isoform X2 [Mya arenaria]XP_052798075.1 uncharacterized protein LOC128230101 isoform X2 [Mya arenaria]XP_052798076.1 uncharacterized protein LOC128230101 isoform X2 [Mya arenaria]XP_052798077.1 uncharacterized protein LOC128230101 isoform X2 [Mya arenaria]
MSSFDKLLALVLPTTHDVFSYCRNKVKAVCEYIYDTCHLQLHSKRTEEKNNVAITDMKGNRKKSFIKSKNKNSERNREPKIHLVSILLIAILALVIPCAAAAAAAAADVTINDSGQEMCTVNVNQGLVIINVTSDVKNDILNFGVGEDDVGDCAKNTEEAVILPNFQHQYNISLTRSGHCIFKILDLNVSQAIVNIFSEATALTVVLINGKDNPECKDPWKRSFVLKASHNELDVDPEAGVPLTTSTTTVTETIESKLPINGWPAWAYAVLVIGIVVIIAIPIVIIRVIRFLASRRTEEVDPEADVLQNMLNETNGTGESIGNAPHSGALVSNGSAHNGGAVVLNGNAHNAGAVVSIGNTHNAGEDLPNGDANNAENQRPVKDLVRQIEENILHSGPEGVSSV